MSKIIPKPPNIESTERKSESPPAITSEPVEANGLITEHTNDVGVEENKVVDTAAEFPVNGIGEAQKALKSMDMPSLELSDNEFNSTDSDSFAGRPLKNRTLEMKLSAIIEKACSSDAEAEDLAEVQSTLPTLPPTNVTVTLPNNELLFTVEGVTVPLEIASHVTSQETVSLPVESTKKSASARVKKYRYKLKGKGGKVLTYASLVPVELKKPRICLTKINLGEMFDADTKQSRGKRKALPTSSMMNGKRGRGQSSTKLSPIVDDTADVTDVKSNNDSSSFGMQTRKRKMKFLPDGRILCIAKRRRSSSSSSASAISDDGEDPPPKESTDEDWEATGDDLRKLNALSVAKEVALNEPKPPVKTQTPKFAKSATPKSAPSATLKSAKSAIPMSTLSELLKSAQSATPKSAKSVTRKSTKLASVLAPNVDDAIKTPVANSRQTVSAPKPSSSVVNPAQLLSTLLGVTIRPNQLHSVRFKPKTVQKQHPAVQKTIMLSGDNQRGVSANFKASTPMKVATVKPLMQTILPKSSLSTVFNKTVSTPPSPSTPSVSSMAPCEDLVSAAAVPAAAEEPLEVPSFDHFTDSRTVRTKAGPKKLWMQKERLRLSGDKLSRASVYDLVQNVFERMPSWNLHVMPDTNSFCIAQVGRGRMGIPILRKSVELADNFAAKIYVHQLHCKKFDGVYDTEAKFNDLFAEIDSMAA